MSGTVIEDGASQLPRTNPAQLRAMLESTTGWRPFPASADRARWDQIASSLPPQVVDDLAFRARSAVRKGVVPLPLSRWREFTLTGERKGYERLWYQRRSDVTSLLLTWCLLRDSALLDPLLGQLWAICEETTWCFPAHEREFPDPQQPVVDLFSSLTGVGLAELLAVMGDDIPAALQARITAEVDQRVITPYLTNDTWRWLYDSADGGISNWTAVCAFGAAGAACYLEEDSVRLAAILDKAGRSLEDYLGSFDPDGGTSEGTGYWGFGFGSFCQLADLVERRTGGQWNWFDAPIVARIARFPLRSRTTLTSWPTFSDSSPHPRFSGPLLVDLADRFGDPDLVALARTPVADWGWVSSNAEISNGLRSVTAQHVTPEAAMPPLASSDYFRGLQWLLSRADPTDPDTLAVAVKGGTNGEMHNQNDIGSLIVRAGGEDLVVDPGWGVYTRDYFNEHRYEHFVNRSYGHSTPRPAHVEQQPGRHFRAELLDLDRGDTKDRIVLDLTGAYPPVAWLEHLSRTVLLERGDRPRVSLTDHFAFAEPAVAETAFITFADVRDLGDQLVLRGESASVTVTIPADTTLTIDTQSVELYSGTRSVTRVAVASQPQRRTTLQCVIEEAHLVANSSETSQDLSVRRQSLA